MKGFRTSAPPTAVASIDSPRVNRNAGVATRPLKERLACDAKSRYPTLPAFSSIHLARFGGLLLDLVLLLIVIYRFQLVSRAFFEVAVLAAIGFAVHALLPLRYRLRFFVLLSVAGVGVAFGLLDGAWLLALGMALMLLCHLPVSFRIRVTVLLLAGAALAVLRAGVVPAPWSPSIWPILGSMFMFRIALYLYALKHDRIEPSFTRGVAYFFMLPNVCFPLFPVVDYSTFSRTHYEGDEYEIYRTGVTWMVRGLVHLILYRLVYLHLVVGPSDIMDLGTLVQHLLSTFLLYLRVSGEFHLIVGMLHLFGFRLPETHRLYYLASSFTDFWRRINIYWKDFMMKLVYYPIFFQLRRWGAQRALVISTIIVFAGTWLLHSYQWFWLRGDFPLTLEDGLFWCILGALVVANVLRESKRGRDRSKGTRVWSATLALQTVGTFVVLCVLWSLWSAESVSRWLFMWTAATQVEAIDAAWIVGLLAVGLAIAGRNWNAPGARRSPALARFASPMVRTRAMLVLLVVLGAPNLLSAFSPEAGGAVASLQEPKLNTRDEALQHRGYYERLDNVDRLTEQLWQTYATRPMDWVPLGETRAWRVREDFLVGDLRPSSSIAFYRQPLTVNEYGMRDRSYSVEKPSGTYRVAILGPSIIMGAGSGDDETIDVYLEERLNREDRGPTRYEVLNFGISAYSIVQQVEMVRRALQFDPDLILIADSPGLRGPVIAHLLDVLFRGIDIPYPKLRELLASTGADELGATGYAVPFEAGRRIAGAFGIPTRMPWNEAEIRLRMSADEIVAWALDEIARDAREAGTVPVFALMDVVRDPNTREVPALDAARRAGLAVMDLREIYTGHDLETLRAAEWDRHPNAVGNQLIAAALYEELARLGILQGQGAPRPAAGMNLSNLEGR